MIYITGDLHGDERREMIPLIEFEKAHHFTKMMFSSSAVTSALFGVIKRAPAANTSSSRNCRSTYRFA